jgi:hypothetical protein
MMANKQALLGLVVAWHIALVLDNIQNFDRLVGKLVVVVEI